MSRKAFVLGFWLLACPLSASVIHVPSDYQSIQEAVNAANAGDTVLVAPGTYTGQGNRDIDFNGKNLVLKSELGPEVTIIDCQASEVDQHLGIHLHSGEDSTSVIDGFTVNHAFCDTSIYINWGAIMGESAAPTVRNCIVRDNNCVGISYYLGPNTAYIYSTQVVNNGHGQSRPKPGIRVSINSAFIDSCRVDSNAAEGAFLYHANPIVLHSTFTGNNADGLLVVEFLGIERFTISSCTFSGNGDGLGFYQDWPKSSTGEAASVKVSDTSTISRCLFSNNLGYGITSYGWDFDWKIECCNSFGNGVENWWLTGYVNLDTTNCFTADPLFCDAPSSSPGVSSSSPCLAVNNACGVDIGRIIVGCGPCCGGLRGNVDYDPADAADIGDIVYLVEYAFVAGPPPPCFDEADINGDSVIDIGDLIYLIEWSMADGPAPASCQ